MTYREDREELETLFANLPPALFHDAHAALSNISERIERYEKALTEIARRGYCANDQSIAEATLEEEK